MFEQSQAFNSFSVDDLGKAKEFYGRTLGCDIVENPRGLGLRFANGGETFLYPKENHTPATFTVLNFRVDSVDRAVDDLTGKGVRFEIYDMPDLETDERGILADDEMKIAWFKDPAGNILSVVEDRT